MIQRGSPIMPVKLQDPRGFQESSRSRLLIYLQMPRTRAVDKKHAKEIKFHLNWSALLHSFAKVSLRQTWQK